MKRTILNLIAIAAFSFSGMVFAIDDVEPKAMPVDEGTGQAVMPVEEVAGQAAMPAEQAPQISASESVPVAKSTHRDIPTQRNRSRTLDLRYCLEQESNVAIATCAGEK
jgi:hypothetical protein